MKTIKYLCCVFFVTLCSLNPYAFANDSDYNQGIEQRIDQVVANEQGVFLLVNGCWLSSQAMQATSDEILVLENGEWIPLQEAVRCDSYHVWKCPICGTYNPQGVSRCRNYKNHPK